VVHIPSLNRISVFALLPEGNLPTGKNLQLAAAMFLAGRATLATSPVSKVGRQPAALRKFGRLDRSV